ncbi:hypothetical protein [Nocardia transvalensis]|uniref:hypothetical protein n=1 Tax=Nocardia transvalensis TaxID=37333 RepID=UPI0018940698|nr:hypothetical protein [Nocardia transvalensis]MBF6328652.1 hypothetical protein [Nocardia transvalensis]
MRHRGEPPVGPARPGSTGRRLALHGNHKRWTAARGVYPVGSARSEGLGLPSHSVAGCGGRRGGTAAVRGYLVGGVVAALAVAAHGAAGGGFPGSTALTLLVLAAAGIGAVAGMLPSGDEKACRAVLFAALAGGQLVGHEALAGMVGHSHESPDPASGFGEAQLPTGAMPLAHTLATIACGILIVVAERLYAVVSQVFRDVVNRPGVLTPPAGSMRWPATDSRTYRFLRSGANGSRAPPVAA